MKKYLILITMLLFMNFNAQSQSSVPPSSMPDISSGLGLGMGWTDIPLYRSGEAKPFDYIIFTQKKVKGSSGKYYFASRKSGAALAPYALLHGEGSAAVERSNRELRKFKNDWTRTHIYPQHPYDIRFRLYGDWNLEWLCIKLDEASGEKAWIRRKPNRMGFFPWEDFLKVQMLGFNGHPLYNEPEGNVIQIQKTDHSSYGDIKAIQGDWVEVYDSHTKMTGWLHWRDKDGIFSGIGGIYMIY